MLSHMVVSYSTIKAISEPAAMAELLANAVIGPVMPSVKLLGVRRRPGRRFEAPRVLWNVYEAELELPGNVRATSLFWTKAFFNDDECQDYHKRIQGLLVRLGANPMDPRGYARFIADYNLFLFFFPADPVFPRLDAVFDSAQMAPLLEPHLQRLFGVDRLEALAVDRVKYLPEISAIARYGDRGDIGTGRAIYGKVQHSRKGAFTYEVMKALWDLPARVSGELVIAEPLGYYPEYDLLLQSAVPGTDVEGDRHSDVFMAQAEPAGRMIARIHTSGISVGRKHSVEHEISRLENRLEEFKLSSPRLYLMIRDLLKQIVAQARRIPAEAPVPSHGDYKYNQFLYDGERFGLIDVEYFVQAEPSFDLGKYCGHLVPSMPEHWSDTAQANVARRIFLDAYQSVRPDYKGRRFPIYEALSLATRALVVTWSQTRNWEYTAQTLVALAYERLKARWGE
jgi:aminoglycoside phosphotransferase (APT) family kinase protein